jgi:hypothetical protein
MTKFVKLISSTITLAAVVALAPASAQYSQYPYPEPRRGGLADEIIRGAAEAAATVRGVTDAVQGASYSSADRFAVNACASQANRYGRVSIGDVRPKGRDKTEVRGFVDAQSYGYRAYGYNGGYERRTFTCSVRYDGRITKFKTKSLRY